MSEEVLSGESVQNILHTNVPVLGTMGMEVLEVAPRHVRTRLPFGPHNGNHIGTVYAGVLFSFWRPPAARWFSCRSMSLAGSP